MKTPDKIKDALLRCSNDVCFGDEEICAYRSEGSAYCMMALAKDALAYIEQLEVAHRTEYCEEADYDCMALGKARKRIAELEAKLAAKNDIDNRMEDDLK